MKFDTIFKKKHPAFFEKAQLNEVFISHMNELGTQYYNSVISSIISIMTNNQINTLGQNQGSGDAFKKEPLVGLYKTHCTSSELRSIFMNLTLSKVGIKIIDSPDNELELDIDFTEEQRELENQNLEQLTTKKQLNDKLKVMSGELLNEYQEKRSKGKITGNWLIFGKCNGNNIFLYVKVGYDHSKAVDKEVYQTLVDMYSEEFIRNLKSGK